MVELPGYEILEELGRGGMGVVYKARQQSLNRIVALKMLLAGTHANFESLARFRIEARATARLEHPNIVRVYDFGDHAGLPYFSMEFVAGHSLQSRLNRTAWEPRRAARLVSTLALAVHHAHEHGIIHRDLKPANVLFDAEGSPKVTDFGLAKELEANADLTGTGQIMGTPRYMSPEQAAGNSKAVGPASDVHALGTMLYELLTGQPAFGGKSFLETLDLVRWTEPRPPSIVHLGVPASLDSICADCLQKDPLRRIASAEHLAHALADFDASDGPVLPKRDTSSRSPQRDRWWLD